jgi:hypothetical protein
MKKPERTDLQYFAYGPFKPKEPAFYKIEPSVSSIEPFAISGCLCVRDGLPMLDLNYGGHVEGVLLSFKDAEQAAKAYQTISEYYPSTTHTWEIMTITPSGVQFNTVVRHKPDPWNEYFGSYELTENWSAKDDPLFSKAMHVVADGIKDFRNASFDKDEGEKFDWKRYYTLQMKYLLLWSILERFISLKESLNPVHDHFGQMDNRQSFASVHQPFRIACSKHISKVEKLTSFSDPGKYSVLNSDEPNKCIDFFHLLRTNLIHRGKSAEFDAERLRRSFIALFGIVREMLTEEGLFR